MLKVIIGEKIDGVKYGFRETYFGICEKNGKLLLVKKNGQYSFIGGGIEKGETKEQCLKREFIEESGYDLISIDELITVDCFWLAAGKWPLESLANFYVVKMSDNHIPPAEKEHIVEEIEIEKVKNLLPLPYQKIALEYYFAQCSKTAKSVKPN